MRTIGTSEGEAGALGRVHGLFASLGPWFLGLCCCNVWIGWMNGAHAVAPAASWHVLCSLTMIATLLVVVAYGWRLGGERVALAYRADWPIALAMAAFTVPASTLATGLPAWLHVMGTVVTEVGMAWLFVRWGVYLARLDLRLCVGCIFGAHVCGCAVKLALYYVPTAACAVPVSVLPLVSVLALGRASRPLAGTPARPAAPGGGACGPADVWCAGTRGAWGPLWKVLAFVACYRLISWVIAVRWPQVENVSLSTICCVAEIAVALCIVYLLFVKSGSFTFQQVWSIFLLLMGIVLFCMGSAALVPVGSSIRAGIGSLLVMFIWLVFADVAHHSSLHPFVIFGAARIAYELPRLVVTAAQASGLALPADGGMVASALSLVLLAFSILFFDWRDPTLALVFSDFQDHATQKESGEIAQAADGAAKRYGLTQREAEVLLYLCQGRTRAYIAETLYLSENTVRTHTQSIYAKLGVHNKTELQRKLGV